MPLPEQGMTQEDVLNTLEGYRAGDLDWRKGKVFAYTFNAGPEVEETIKKAYMMYLSENGLDPTSFPSLVRMEREVVRCVADLLRGDANVVGNFTSGGTESIMLAVKSARDKARAEKPHIKEPEIVLSRTAHSAFHKAAHYFGLKVVMTGFDPVTYKADVASMREAITDNTVLLVASAPSYAQGVVDPVRDIAALAMERGICCHVDSCMGGIMLSVMREMEGFDVPDIDFTVPGVTSISADLHKFGYSAKGASTVLYRNKEYRRHQIFAKTSTTSYAIVNPTMLSTKSGGPVAGAWAVLHFLGRKGYERIFGEVMAGTKKLIDGINATGDLYVLGNPDMCIFSFASDTINVYQLADVMAKKGWYLQPQFSTENTPHCVHITLMHMNLTQVDNFLADLPGCIEEVKNLKDQINMDKLREQIKMMVENLGDKAVDQLAAMAGVDNFNDLPPDMALISSVLDVLPKKLSEALLVEYANNLFA